MAALRIGVVGTIRGITFIRLLQTFGEKACLAAVCENNEAKADEVKKSIPESVKVYEDYDEFLDCGLDAVILTNYFPDHCAFAIKALEKGIAVMSETTAAPTLGDCVKLVRTVEKTGTKYMLGANVPYKRGMQFMRKQFEAGKIGKPYYAEAEYLHHSDNPKPYPDESRHWRRLMPGTYYNMHTLGPLMFVTGSMPKKVTARAVVDLDNAKKVNRLIDHMGAYSLIEMDNGAVFNVTGCCYYGPTSKFFRIIGSEGTIETKRYDETKILYTSAHNTFVPDGPIPTVEEYSPKYDELDMVTKEEYDSFTEEQLKLGHGGIDFWMTVNFIKYLRDEYEPFFNVYRATALSAAAICGWKSVREKCREFEIPDFSKEEERVKYENDFLSPFEDEDSENYIERKASV